MKAQSKHSPKAIRIVLIGGVLLIVGFITWWFFLRHSSTPQGTITLSGRIESDTASVAAKTSGRIREMTVREGDQVEAGQVIAILDDDQIKSREEQAKLVVE